MEKNNIENALGKTLILLILMGIMFWVFVADTSCERSQEEQDRINRKYGAP